MEKDVVNIGKSVVIKGELNGTSAGNTLIGHDSFGDVIQGLGGNDTIQGRGGNDEINGGTGNDTIDGGDGDDDLRGDAGDDVIDGGSSELADHFRGGAGSDSLYGGSGKDLFHYARGDGIDLIIDEPVQVSGIWRFYRDEYYKGDHWDLGPGFYESFFTAAGPDDVVSSFQAIALT